MKKRSAGLLLFRRSPALEVLLAHPGGPFWAHKDAGAWSLPKGELHPGEEPLAAARREFAEELGAPPPAGEPVALGEVTQKSGKVVVAWALEGDFDPARLRSNLVPGTTFPEIDRVAWLSVDGARAKLNPAQAAFLDRLLAALGDSR